GLGYMTSLTVPVVNRTSDERALLGVVGVDIPMSYLERFLLENRSPLSVMAYAVALNPHGLLVAHPRMKRQPRSEQIPPQLDFFSIEGDSESHHHLRDAMLSGTSGQKAIASHVASGTRYSSPVDLNYFYQPLSVGNFSGKIFFLLALKSVAVAVPDSEMTTLMPDVAAPDPSPMLNLSLDREFTLVLADRGYCGSEDSMEEPRGPETALERLKRMYNNQQCGGDLIRRLSLDLSLIPLLSKKWAEDSGVESGFRVRRLMTNGGMTFTQLRDSDSDR
ncbi:unnamed protein product, partial [Cyprideis torosa]